MELRSGRTSTEIAIVPDDWIGRSITELADCLDQVRIPLNDAQRQRRKGDIPYCGANGVLDYVDGFIIDDDIILIAEDGGYFDEYATRPIAYRMIGKCWVNNHAHILKAKPGVDQGFLYYSLVHKNILPFVVNGTRAKLNKSEMHKIIVLLPLSEGEQRVIASVLSDVDALLASLDRLIAKKRDLKQAAMQQLLTGKTRLEGFKGMWRLASLDEIASRATGVWGANKPKDQSVGLIDIIRAGDISQEGVLIGVAQRYLSAAEFAKSKCDLDDLVITTSGNGLGKTWWCDGRKNVAASNFVRVLHPRVGGAIGRFLFYALRGAEGVRQLREHTATSAYPNLRPAFFSAVWIPLPPLQEQVAIATFLSDMDAEISALEARRDKTRALKQGMMQELLTGRIRLV